jgi:monoamine oxidase
VVQARTAIVCVSTAVLAAGALRILPELPAKLAAAEGLPLGLADKVFLKLDEPEAFAAAAFAIDELAGIYGTGLRRQVSVLGETAWATDPWARGSYSHALPGRAGERAVLAAPVDGRLFFAGEACSPHAFSTAHGAWETGERAAREVLAALGI